MQKKIKHSGKIISISTDCIKVQIVQKSACTHCSAAGQCNAAESKEKIVEVTNRGSSLNIGDTVIVTASRKVGYLAVLYGAVVPFFVLVCITIFSMLILNNEPLSALIGLGAMAAYFFSLCFFKDKLKTQLAFEIE